MGPNLLVFHYDPVTRAFAAATLKSAGYRVFETSEPRQAWLLARAIQPAVIVTDYPAFLNPPLPNGVVTLVEAIRADSGLARTRVVSLTADCEAVLIESARRAGITASIKLPVTKQCLLAAVDRHLRRTNS